MDTEKNESENEGVFINGNVVEMSLETFAKLIARLNELEPVPQISVKESQIEELKKHLAKTAGNLANKHPVIMEDGFSIKKEPELKQLAHSVTKRVTQGFFPADKVRHAKRKQ